MLRRFFLHIAGRAYILYSMYYTVFRLKENSDAVRLAAQLKTSASLLKSLNPSAAFVAGERILAIADIGFTYTVKPFEDIRAVANKFGVDVQKIKECNMTEHVFVGQTLVIPD